MRDGLRQNPSIVPASIGTFEPSSGDKSNDRFKVQLLGLDLALCAIAVHMNEEEMLSTYRGIRNLSKIITIRRRWV